MELWVEMEESKGTIQMELAWHIAPKNMLRKISQYNSKVPGLTNQWVSIVIGTLMIVRMEVVQQHLVDLAVIVVESNA